MRDLAIFSISWTKNGLLSGRTLLAIFHLPLLWNSTNLSFSLSLSISISLSLTQTHPCSLPLALTHPHIGTQHISFCQGAKVCLVWKKMVRTIDVQNLISFSSFFVQLSLFTIAGGRLRAMVTRLDYFWKVLATIYLVCFALLKTTFSSKTLWNKWCTIFPTSGHTGISCPKCDPFRCANLKKQNGHVRWKNYMQV